MRKYEDSWILDDFAKKVIKKVDGSESVEEAERNCHKNRFYFWPFHAILQIENFAWGGDAVEELNAIREQVIQLCDPQKILLFGSQAKGTATAKSDIDLCIIAPTNDKRSLLTDLYCDTESDTPIDFLLYTPEEWEHSVADSQSFAHKLNREGVVLYG